MNFLKNRFYASGSMPTFREICSEMGWSAVGSAQTVIKALIEKGFLKRDPQKARGLSLPEAEDFRSVPILGAAPAGAPIEAIEYHRGDTVVPAFVRGHVFAVRVQGDSMMNAGIEDQDLAIVRQAQHAEDGEIVVAMVEGEVTIKRLKKLNKEIWLQPENLKYKPKKITDSSFRILGKVIGLHRYFE
ncbi:MAG: repressor LexA [Deltaproteobacteria bacterium]|nr:repressor LexA [Deltaproteobacteria bacterium]